jgi:hypothetical protein
VFSVYDLFFKDDILPTFVVDTSSKKCEEIEDYQCIPLQKCKNGEVLTNQDVSSNTIVRNGILEIVLGDIKCNSILEVCCKLSTVSKKTEEVTTPEHITKVL